MQIAGGLFADRDISITTNLSTHLRAKTQPTMVKQFIMGTRPNQLFEYYWLLKILFINISHKFQF